MRRRAGALPVLVLGLATTAAVHGVAPVAIPLFDGVIVSDPYRFLSPPPGGEGSPTSAAATIPIEGGVSPSFAVYTSETPPQAELLAHGGELAIGDSTTVTVKIDPITPPFHQAGGSVAGNVYRFAVTDQSGAPLALLPGQTITLAMRGPAGVSADAAIARFVDGAWQALPTDPSGLQDLFLTNASAFGDFAILGTAPAPSSGLDPGILILGLVGVGFIALLGLAYRGPALGTGGTAAARRGARRTRGRPR